MMSDPSPHSPDQVADDAEGDFSPPASTAQQSLPFVVKNRTSSGCLIVRKKGNDSVGGSGSSSARNVFRSKKEKKRARMNMDDSGSGDELLMPPRRRVAPETLRVCSVLSHFDSGAADENDIGRKRIRNNEVNLVGRGREDMNERKRNRLDVFEFDEYDESDEEMRRKPFGDGRMEGKRYFNPMTVGRSGLQREFETGSSRHPCVDRSGLYLERKGANRGDNGGMERSKPRPFYGDKYDSDGNIRVQGKSGVLKVMVNKKKKVSGSLNNHDSLEVEEKRKGLRSEDIVKRNTLIRPSFYSDSKNSEKAGSSVSKPKSLNTMKSSSLRLPVRNGTIEDQDSEDSETSLKLVPVRVEKNKNSSKSQLSTRISRVEELHSEDSDTSLKLGLRSTQTRKFTKKANKSGKIDPRDELTPSGSKEGKVKRGTGTEKQKLRERIREMLLSKGWTIDYRPRRNRDYQDAVYINPSGTAYWSIIKAYDALQKQLKDEEEQAKAKGDDSFRPLPDEVLSQLTRKTRKKMEKEMKKKQRDAEAIENARETAARRTSSLKYDEDSMDSDSHEEKLSSFVKQSGSGKSVKKRMKGDQPHASMEPSGVDSRPGKKSRKLGRCTLLVRNSNEGLNSDSDGYVPYSGKRTVLSWLIDCGAVKLSQKVRYMNRRRTKAMLEGWATRDGIHCGCCSKILTVSKFEIHAGGKQRQPFQNIYLDSGVSLLECQIDAWNRQESVESIGFHSVDVDGDDPNDDTCGLCGDGGDLICCDKCPSTFHQSCLDIEMLPPGDWHCPRCICYFCGSASEDVNQDDEATVSGLLTCSLCAKRYHKSCSQGVDALSNDTDSSTPCFCGKTCKEVFEQLQKYLGVKHELESGLSWSLIRRTDVDLDIHPQGRPQRVECNSKLAVALSIMDECFLPIVDRRSGVNILHNVLYNSGSNFSRLNYSGFYTAILERGDEVVAAASIRLHGTQLAEMPFIGTRHIYRRQGMCRHLLNAIESALSSMKVQKLIIPAISELTHTWTEVFGFTNVDKTLKQELKSINMLVFPGIDLLQKQLLGPENINENKSIATGERGTKIKDDQCTTPEAAVRSDNNSSAKNDSDDANLERASRGNDEVSTRNADPQIMDVPFSEFSSNENKISAPLNETPEMKSPSVADKLGDKPESRSPAENHSLLDSSHENEISEPAKETVDTDIGPSETENLRVVDKMDDDVTKLSSRAENHSLLDSSHKYEISEPAKETVNTDFGPSETENPRVADKMEDDATELGSIAENHSGPLDSSKDNVNPAPLQEMVNTDSAEPAKETVNTDFGPSETENPCVAYKMEDDATELGSIAENHSGPLGSSKDNVNPAPLQETVNTDSAEIRSPCVADKVDNIPGLSSSAANNDDTLVMNGSLDSNNEQEYVASVERTTTGADVDSGSKLPKSTSDLAGDSQEENKLEVFSPAKEENIQSCKVEDSHELNLNESASTELKMSTSVEDTRTVEHPLNGDTVNGSAEIESIPVVDQLTEDKSQSREGKAEPATADVSSIDTAPSAIEIDGADQSSLQTNFDQKDEMVCDHSIKDSS